MLMPLMLAAAVLAQETDTTVAVRPGTRLDLNNYAGTVTVKAWTRSEVRIQATHGSRDHIEIEYAGSLLSVKAQRRHGMPFGVDYQISVPEWMKVQVSGVETEVSVEGTRAAISVETVEGAVTVKGGADYVALKSVEGDVTLEGARGRVDINAVDGAVVLRNIVGDVTVEAVDGDVELDGVEAANVDVSTVDGSITFSGPVRNGGSYSLSTHDGDVTMNIPEGTNATFSVATFSGDFVPGFPIPQTKQGQHRMVFTLGTGSARVELESFDGTIALNKAGQRRREE